MTSAAAGASAGPRNEDDESLQPPAWWQHLWFLWGLRVALARGSLLQRTAILPAIFGAGSLIALTAWAYLGAWRLFTSAGVLHDALMSRFLLLLLGFLASTMWIAWPVVTAGVDDAAELSRFALFPVPARRLFLASVLAGLLEPRALPIWGALCGTAAAMLSLGAHAWTVVCGTLGLALCSVIWGRVGLHVLLNVLRHRRSAEAMGVGLLFLLGCSVFVPPPDLSWLRSLTSATPTVNAALLTGAIDLFTLLPTGGWASAMYADLQRDRLLLWLSLAYLWGAVIIGYWMAFWLLERFHRRAGRGLPQRLDLSRGSERFSASGLRWVLAERELRDCWLNPRTRLTVALPFFLGILLKLVGARALASELLGPLADAYLMGGLASYGAFVQAAGFAQNCFGYDAGGAQLLLGAPIHLQDVLKAKNLVHGGLAFTLCVALVAFYCAYLGVPAAWVLAATLSNAAFQSFLFIALGNVLSTVAPRKFHPSLKRRDRASAISTLVGLGAASLGVLPGLTVLKSVHGSHPTVLASLATAILPAFGWLLWYASVPVAIHLLDRRKAELLKAVARE